MYLHMEGGAEKIHFFLGGRYFFYWWRKGDQNHVSSFLDSRSNLTSTFSFVKSSEYNAI
jgi:hypothetical protein